jgi:hypothetical protein
MTEELETQVPSAVQRRGKWMAALVMEPGAIAIAAHPSTGETDAVHPIG